ASALGSSGGAIVSQTLKLLLGTVSAVGNFFIVLFLGLAFAAQPAVYYDGLLVMTPAKYRARATVIVDRIGETLERWLIAQIITMFVVFAVTWIGLAIIGIQSSFILGIQAGLLAFIPTLGAIIAGLIGTLEPSRLFFRACLEHDLRANAFRVCREGTHHAAQASSFRPRGVSICAR